MPSDFFTRHHPFHSFDIPTGRQRDFHVEHGIYTSPNESFLPVPFPSSETLPDSPSFGQLRNRMWAINGYPYLAYILMNPFTDGWAKFGVPIKTVPLSCSRGLWHLPDDVVKRWHNFDILIREIDHNMFKYLTAKFPELCGVWEVPPSLRLTGFSNYHPSEEAARTVLSEVVDAFVVLGAYTSFLLHLCRSYPSDSRHVTDNSLESVCNAARFHPEWFQNISQSNVSNMSPNSAPRRGCIVDVQSCKWLNWVPYMIKIDMPIYLYWGFSTVVPFPESWISFFAPKASAPPVPIADVVDNPTFPQVKEGSGQRPGETMRAYFERRKETRRKMRMNESSKRRESRLQAAKAQARKSAPGKKGPLVYHWREEGSHRIRIRTLLPRNQASDQWSFWRKKEKIYDSFSNQWDCCSEWSFTADDDANPNGGEEPEEVSSDEEYSFHPASKAMSYTSPSSQSIQAVGFVTIPDFPLYIEKCDTVAEDPSAGKYLVSLPLIVNSAISDTQDAAKKPDSPTCEVRSSVPPLEISSLPDSGLQLPSLDHSAAVSLGSEFSTHLDPNTHQASDPLDVADSVSLGSNSKDDIFADQIRTVKAFAKNSNSKTSTEIVLESGVEVESEQIPAETHDSSMRRGRVEQVYQDADSFYDADDVIGPDTLFALSRQEVLSMHPLFENIEPPPKEENLEDLLYYRYGYSLHESPYCKSPAPATQTPKAFDSWTGICRTIGGQGLSFTEKTRTPVVDFLNAILATETPLQNVPGKFWDLSPLNFEPLKTFQPLHFQTVVKDFQNGSMCLLMPASNTDDSDWCIGVDAVTSLECVRRVLGPSLMDITDWLIEQGISFCTLSPVPFGLTSSPVSDLPSILGERRKDSYKFDIADFAAYEAMRDSFLVGRPEGRAALCFGGIIARLARETLPNSVVYSGPSESAIKGKQKVFSDGRALFVDDTLSEAALDLICGTYRVETGRGSQEAMVSWFPRANKWETSGYHVGFWNKDCEDFYLNRRAAILEGKAFPLSGNEWRTQLRRTRTATKLRFHMQKASLAYLKSPEANALKALSHD